MKGYYRHILAATAVLLTTAACNKNEPDGPQQINAPIAISATEAGTTKALLDNGTFKTTGNRIQVYDFVTSEGNVAEHINDHIGPELNSNSPLHTPGYTWPFVNGPHQWCPGVHKFFGWLAKDANMTSSNTPEVFFGQGFSFNNYVLTIPQVAFTKDTPQFDFMYSNIYITEPINTPVPLEFSHLFSAFYITGENKQDETVYDIKSITLRGLNNTQSATINFSPGNETGTANPVVTYTDTGASNYGFVFDFSSTDTTLSKEDGQKNLTGIYLMWPQKTEYFTDAKLVINYTYVVSGSETTAPEKEIDLSSMNSWEPGQIKKLNLVFNVDQITFRIEELVDWDDEAEKDIPVQM